MENFQRNFKLKDLSEEKFASNAVKGRKDRDQNRGLDLIFTNLLGLTMDG